MGRFGDPEEDIGRAVVALTSPDFKYMSGETITLEGGMGLRP
jgi:NAD(P)-dependent dehydrogenase (short-subunit alcohol dehydrogenase family)